MSKRRFTRLDGLRGVAALGVMVFHLSPPSRPGLGLMDHGYLAVDLFFLLSGFVIAYTYEAKLREGWSVDRFIIARAIRLYPLVAAAVAAVLVLRCAYPVPSLPSLGLLGNAALNTLLIPDLREQPGQWFLSSRQLGRYFMS